MWRSNEGDVDMFTRMIIRGYKNPLEQSDLYDLNDVDKAGAWLPQFEKAWNYETNKLIRWLMMSSLLFTTNWLCAEV